jgi:hypothetical protein
MASRIVWKTRQSVIAAARRVGNKNGGRLTADQLRDEGGIGMGVVSRLFPRGKFLELRRLAELHPATPPSRVSPSDALEEFHRVALKLGGLPSWNLFKTHGKFNPQVLAARFGGRVGLWKAYDKWLRARGKKRPGPHLAREGVRRIAGEKQDGCVGPPGTAAPSSAAANSWPTAASSISAASSTSPPTRWV